MQSDAYYNDRAKTEAQYVAQAEVQTVAKVDQVVSGKIPKPEISIIVEGNKLYKPGMKSVFVEEEGTVTVGDVTSIEKGDNKTIRAGSYCSCNSVTYCTCNTVCTCESVCTCQAVCSCVGHCSCNQVCSCDGHCSCNQVCTCDSQCTCQSRSTGGGSYCSCVPVH